MPSSKLLIKCVHKNFSEPLKISGNQRFQTLFAQNSAASANILTYCIVFNQMSLDFCEIFKKSTRSLTNVSKIFGLYLKILEVYLKILGIIYLKNTLPRDRRTHC